MEIIKRKILLEDSIDRSTNSPTWGTLTATSFYLNVMLTQNIDDGGIFTDTPTENPIHKESDYFANGGQITAYTESVIEDLRTYKNDEQYKVGFNTREETYINFRGDVIHGIDQVTKFDDEGRVYVIDANSSDPHKGTIGQTSGLLYTDYPNAERILPDGTSVPLTRVIYRSEGWNKSNTTYSGLTKEEYLFGIISKPEVKSNVFIDRGETSVTDRHLRLGEIRNLDELVNYGNGFYNINKI